MYNIYVTNKTRFTAYTRLQSTKLASTDFVKELEELKNTNTEMFLDDKKLFHPLLVPSGFYPILPKTTISLSIQDMSSCMYASVYQEGLWVVDFSVYPKMYGYVAIKSYFEEHLGEVRHFVLSNPKPVWISAKSGDHLPKDIIEAGNSLTEETAFYFGRSHASLLPCNVTATDGRCVSWSGYDTGDFLKNTGYELVRAKRGDPIPPHAVMTGVTEADGSLYVGRVGGNIPCSIITDQENGTIKCFSYSEGKKVSNGEILLLTNDPYI